MKEISQGAQLESRVLPVTYTWRDLSHTQTQVLSCETKEPFWTLTSARFSDSPERKIMIQPRKNIKPVAKLVKLQLPRDPAKMDSEVNLHMGEKEKFHFLEVNVIDFSISYSFN